MFLGRKGLLLGSQRLQGSDDPEACIPGFDDIINIPIFGSLVWVSRICSGTLLPFPE
jgi:hypothetical protein